MLAPFDCWVYTIVLTGSIDEQAAEQFIAAANAFRMQKQGMNETSLKLPLQ